VALVRNHFFHTMGEDAQVVTFILAIGIFAYLHYHNVIGVDDLVQVWTDFPYINETWYANVTRRWKEFSDPLPNWNHASLFPPDFDPYACSGDNWSWFTNALLFNVTFLLIVALFVVISEYVQAGAPPPPVHDVAST
jgi:hypothetical protein